MKQAILLLVLLVALTVATQVQVEVRSYDGKGNNKANPTWGAVGKELLKAFAPVYADGLFSIPNNLPTPKDLSDALFGVKPANGGFSKTSKSNMHTAIGFLAMHDVARGTSGTVPAPIPVKTTDLWFNPKGTPNTTTAFTRQQCAVGSGTAESARPCAQVQGSTAFMDLSIIYGTTDAHRAAVMEKDAAGNVTGRINVYSHPDHGDWLPLNAAGAFSLSAATPSGLFPPADALLIIFVREHNRLAADIKRRNPRFTGSQIFEEARRWNIAQYQAVIFGEYYQATASQPMPVYRGYSESVDPSVNSLFYAAMVRYGHSEIVSIIERRDENGFPSADGHLLLRDVFRQPKVYFSSGLEPVLRGAASSLQQEVDLYYVDEMRIWAGTIPGQGAARDTVSLTIQRGRDLGFPSYNAIRGVVGVPKITHFENITTDSYVLSQLSNFYPGGVETIDFWVGTLAESHPNRHLGPTLEAIFKDQLIRLRDGDRFYFKNRDAGFSASEIREIERVRLSDIILRNTRLTRLPCGVLYVTDSWNCGERGPRGVSECSRDNNSV